MFYRDQNDVCRARPLDGLEWLAHGFGTRHTAVFPIDAKVATLHQIHSDICVPARGRTGQLGDGDGLLESTPGHLVGVKTADCLPILLVDEEHRAVAAVHAGWRGTVRGIARAALDRMREEFGTRAEFVHAAIGPGIGKCCFAVGPEVAAQFGDAGAATVDLAAANREQLVESGVSAERIYAAGLCTMCGADEFHSYRRDKEQAGRMLSVVGVK